MLDRNDSAGRRRFFPDVLRAKTKSPGSMVVVKNPGNVVGWAADRDGVVRLGITVDDGDRFGVIFRESEEAAWREMLPAEGGRGQLRPLGFDPAGEKLYVSGLTPNRRRTIFLLDLKTGQLGEPLAPRHRLELP